MILGESARLGRQIEDQTTARPPLPKLCPRLLETPLFRLAKSNRPNVLVGPCNRDTDLPVPSGKIHVERQGSVNRTFKVPGPARAPNCVHIEARVVLTDFERTPARKRESDDSPRIATTGCRGKKEDDRSGTKSANKQTANDRCSPPRGSAKTRSQTPPRTEPHGYAYTF